MSNLPENIAKECFLFEAKDYLLVGHPPMVDIQYGYYNARYSYDLYIDGIEKFPHNCCFITNLFHEKYNITEHVENIVAKSEAIQELLQNGDYEGVQMSKDYLYLLTQGEIISTIENDLINQLRNGIISSTGLLVQKYDETQKEFIDIDEDWYYKAVCKEIGYKYGEYIEPQDSECTKEKLERVSIPKEYWIYDNINFPESSLEFKIGNDRYKYLFVLISFQDLYNNIPRQLEYEVTGKLLGNRIIYNSKTYQEITENNDKGRKSLNWDLFYAELLRYIIENEKSVLPKKQEVTTTHMQNWCKNTGFSTGSRGSIQPKISAIYNALQKVKK